MVRSVLLLSLLIAVAFAGKSKSATTTAADAEAFIRGAASSFLGAEIPAAAKCSTSFSKTDLTTLTTALNDFKTFDPMAWSNAFSKISPIMKDVKACASSAGTDATEAKAFEAKLMKSFGANSFLTDAWDVLTKDHSTLWSEAFGSGGMIPSFEAKNFGAAGTKFGDIVVTIVNTNTALVQTTDDHWSEVEPLSEADTSTYNYECNPAKTCNGCSECCHAYIPDGQSCDACVKKACPVPPPPPPPNQCTPATTCNVCSECCHTYIPDGKSCDECVKNACPAPPPPPPRSCSGYEIKHSGTCTTSIASSAACHAAARTLGKSFSYIDNPYCNPFIRLPSGCYMSGYHVYFNTQSGVACGTGMSIGSGYASCICACS